MLVIAQLIKGEISFLRELGDTLTDTLGTSNCIHTYFLSIPYFLFRIALDAQNQQAHARKTCHFRSNRERFKPLLLILYHMEGLKVCHGAKNLRQENLPPNLWNF